MKYNQFAATIPSTKDQILELQKIAIYPTDLAQYPFAELVNHVFRQFFPEFRSPETQNEQLANILVAPHQDLATALTTVTDQVDQLNFYNAALQLLGFFVDEDFDLREPLTTMAALNLPFVSEKQLDFTHFTQAIYQLMNTRSKNGLTFLDNLASRGYYQLNLSAAEREKPLIFNGKVQATYDFNNVIREIVYVESDLDTDNDGQRDLLAATIIRPKLSQAFLKVPVLYTANPYFLGTTDTPMNPVDLPLTKKPLGDARENGAEFDQFVSFKTERPTAEQLADPFSQNESTVQATTVSSVVLNDFFLARGFASVYAAGIGSRGSDGIGTCGSPEETDSVTAIIEWLHGDRRAYTDHSRQHEIKATWCNGRVAMTGKSYLGTLAIAAAATGVAGLETVISEAAISSWYDYYREHGLVVAPETFQGEDADVLANECFSRQKDAGSYDKVHDFYQEKLAQMKQAQDRMTGSYNHFWDVRNYRNNLDQVKCPIVSVHGLNDWNVKPKNVYKLNQELHQLGKTHKVILHQGQHIYINNFPSLDFYDLINLWLTNKLLDVNNHADEIFPDYLVQSNLDQFNWTTPASWTNGDQQTQALTTEFAADAPTESFTDNGTAAFKQSGLGDLAWEQAFINQDARFSNNQIVLKTAKLNQEQLLSGRPVVHLRLKDNADYGLISAMLVDYGVSHRLATRPQTVAFDARQFGYGAPLETTMEFAVNPATTSAKLICKGHLNLQNPHHSYQNEAWSANEFQDVDLRLQPTYFHLAPGHQLGLIIYATDMSMTMRGQNELQYTVDLANSSLSLYRK
ncbi:Xaa-Pro dipeptidyl-peptidase [Lapidilactobacillus wuchangensis]|uniref:Xaa-Pro dipeptidyl-peptidase n=1 Tax=Lapidilactobacillus wuchangensis TaxID=2486001 RepID=UPI000F7B36F6|nr:Xaa-Pro dipeptidyl-peptidase [Lapidilactobacillus wuchangensis]